MPPHGSVHALPTPPARSGHAALLRDLAEAFRPHVDRLATAIDDEIRRRAQPEYTRLLDGPFGQLVTRGIRNALGHALARAGGSVPAAGALQPFRRLGEAEFAEGRDLTFLQTAFGAAGRVAWRYLADFGRAHRIPAELLFSGAEAVFCYVDAISAATVEGYASAESSAEQHIAERRRRLLEQILAGPQADSRTLAELAAGARWQLPERVIMVALDPHDDRRPQVSATDSGVLADLTGDQPFLLLSDPDRLESVLAGARAAVGPAVSPGDAARSLTWARTALTLARRGVIPRAQVVRCEDHLGTLCLSTDRFLLTALGSHSLAPLDGLTAKQREKLSQTLFAWLRLRSSAPELAAELDVHPQTVRNRLRQLRKLFGDRLDDPDERFALELALRAAQINDDEARAERVDGARRINSPRPPAGPAAVRPVDRLAS